jgi:SAM-dependent methyltransferase
MTLQPVQRWHIDEELIRSPAVTNRNLLAQKYAAGPIDHVLRQYIQMDLMQTHAFYSNVLGQLSPGLFRGTGLELGSGVCAFSGIVCEAFPDVDQIYAVELVPDVVTHLQPVTIPAVAPNHGDRIVRVIGSFDELEIPDGSVDFAIEVASLHHSNDLQKTLAEAARVIKPGGHLIAIDRVHPDQMTDAQREFMLGVEYPTEWLMENGYDKGPLTRRENGEHEIRKSEWVSVFATSGFEIETHLELRDLNFAKLLRGAQLRLPFPLRRQLNILPSRVRWHDGEWFWTLRALLGAKSSRVFSPSTRNYSLYVARRT